MVDGPISADPVATDLVNAVVPVVQAGANKKAPASLFAAASVSREKLTANRTYYVRTDGSDSNTGLVNTAGGAFQTLQKAADTIAALDGNGFTATIQQGTAGALTAGVSFNRPIVGFLGITLDLGGGSLTVTGGNCVSVVAPISVTVANGTFSTVTSGIGLYVFGQNSAIIIGAGVTLGACATSKIWVDLGGRITGGSNFTLTGGSPYWLYTQFGGFADFRNCTITASGTPAWGSEGIHFDMLSNILLFSVTFSGAATGKRYAGTLNAVLQSFGAGTVSTYFPGNSNGTTATGAQQA